MRTVLAIAIVLALSVVALAQAPQPQQPPAQAKPVAPPLPKTLFENLPAPLPAYISAYPDQPVERLTMVCLIRQMIDRLAEQQRAIVILTQSVQELQKQVAVLQKPPEPPIDKNDKPVDAPVEPTPAKGK